jgi:hypothetical protein
LISYSILFTLPTVVINEGVGGGEDGEDGGFDFDDEGDSSDGEVDIAAI